MTKNTKTILLLFIFNLTCAASVFAWDDTGHKVTANIAWRQMTPDVRVKVMKLLLDAPEDSHLAVYYPSGSLPKEAKELELFMVASTWSDIIRDRDFKVRYEKYNKGPWHYADIFWKETGGKAEMLENKSEGLAITKLYDFDKLLRDAAVSDKEKAVNLAWFLHVAGDVHNPLHNASRITEVEPKGDQGGNLFLLSTAGENSERVNLHGYWDSILRRNAPRKNDDCDDKYIASIADKIISKYPYSKMQSRLKLGEYREWNTEGFNLLNGIVYSPELKRGELPAKKYQKAAFQIGQEQTALAGYRMGQTLNRIFGQPSA